MVELNVPQDSFFVNVIVGETVRQHQLCPSSSDLDCASVVARSSYDPNVSFVSQIHFESLVQRICLNNGKRNAHHFTMIDFMDSPLEKCFHSAHQRLNFRWCLTPQPTEVNFPWIRMKSHKVDWSSIFTTKIYNGILVLNYPKGRSVIKSKRWPGQFR